MSSFIDFSEMTEVFEFLVTPLALYLGIDTLLINFLFFLKLMVYKAFPNNQACDK